MIFDSVDRRLTLSWGVFVASVLLGLVPSRLDSQSELARFDGLAEFDELGYSVAVVGDLDGDGYVELIAGADEASPGGRIDAGQAIVFSSRDLSIVYSIEGEFALDFLGWSVSGAGDVNGDGVADFVIGAPFASPGGLAGAGLSVVHSGADGSLIWRIEGDDGSDGLGSSVSGAGDVNGDGFDDVVIGVPYNSPGGVDDAGSAVVISGMDGSPILVVHGEVARDHFGISVSGAGDVNGDGFADIIVGAIGFDNAFGNRAGAAYIVLGPTGTAHIRLEGEAGSIEFGTSVSRAGDVDGDGCPEVVVGSPKASDNGIFRSGNFIVFDGLTGQEKFRVNGRGVEDRLGISVAAAGDVDGDGYGDVVGGAYRADPMGLLNAGEVWIAHGPDGVDRAVIESVSAAIRFGFSVAGGGDMNGDSFSDLVIGADELSPGGRRGAGAAYLYSGEDLSRLAMRGNVDVAFSGIPQDVLFLNGVSGSGDSREVVLGIDDPISVFMDRPASLMVGTARYCLYVAIGAAGSDTNRRQEILDLFFGHFSFPTPLNPEPNSIRKTLSNLRHLPIFGPNDAIPNEAPTIVFSRAIGARRAVVATLQGFIVDSASPSGALAVTNGITLRVVE